MPLAVGPSGNRQDTQWLPTRIQLVTQSSPDSFDQADSGSDLRQPMTPARLLLHHMDREHFGRRENRDVANPSKGLLPQLVEVLYALADSQEILTDRIRIAHLEFLGIHPRDGAGSSRPIPLSPLGPPERPPIATTQTPAPGDAELFTPEPSALSTESSANPAESTSSASSEDSGGIINDPEVVAPSNMPIETATSIGQSDGSQSATPITDEVWVTRRDEPTTQQGDRSYNYFDELDARLADLGHSENGSEEAEL